jgi:hypothetical protein
MKVRPYIVFGCTSRNPEQTPHKPLTDPYLGHKKTIPPAAPETGYPPTHTGRAARLKDLLYISLIICYKPGRRAKETLIPLEKFLHFCTITNERSLNEDQIVPTIKG